MERVSSATAYESGANQWAGQSNIAFGWKSVLRIRYEISVLLIIAAVLPAFVRGHFTFEGMSSGNNLTTMFSVAIASILAYLVQRKLVEFPGIRSSSHVFIIFAGSFLVMSALLLLTRWGYARSTFLAGFVLSTGFAYGVGILRQLVLPLRLAVLPFGNVSKLPPIGGIQWKILDESQAVNKLQVDGVVVDLRADLPVVWERFIAESALEGIPVYHVKQVRESLTGKVEIEHLFENTLGSLNPDQTYLKLKDILDRVVAVIVLLIIWPLLLAIVMLIKWDSPGPALFVQTRRGYRGREFRMFKFRTMELATAVSPVSTEPDGGGKLDATQQARKLAMTKSADSRVTHVGGFLRRTRLDELPQIINILRGEMTWIGPRPEALELSKWYEEELPFYIYRHIVKPGISGWAQVTQGHVAEVEDVHLKLHYDFYYIKNFSPWLDLLIVLRTFHTMLTGMGAR